MSGTGWLKRLWNDRWLGLVVGMWIQACGGLSYTQEQIDGLGTAKDIGGNVGILSGLLMDVFPPWSLIVVGAILNTFGFSLLWLSVTKFIRPPYWQMCGLLMTGTQGSTFFNTAVLVTCMRNFPAERGVVVGLLVGVIGLSGAIFTQIYLALLAPDEESFLLLAAVLPSAVGLSVMWFIRPLEEQKVREDTDKAGFFFSYTMGFALAAYLMVIIIAQDLVEFSGRAMFISTLLMFIMLALPLASPVLASLRGYHSLASVESLSAGSKGSAAGSKLPSPQLLSRATSQEGLPPSLSLDSSDTDPSSKLPPHAPRLGQDFTLLQACRTLDYWLLFIAMGCGAGSGLTAINNLAQMAEALGSDSVDTFVSLLSVWNFVGRLGAGYVSERYVQAWGTPRPLFLVLVLGGMAVAHLLLASGVVRMLYLGSVLVGLFIGALWSLMVAAASDLFGLTHFGALYNTLSMSATVGSYICSVKLAGYIYDSQAAAARAKAEQLLELGFISALPELETCLGPQCFRLTFCIMAAICLLGLLLTLRLVARTRSLYWDLHKRSQLRSSSRLLKKDSSKDNLRVTLEDGFGSSPKADSEALQSPDQGGGHGKKYPAAGGATERRHGYKKESSPVAPSVRTLPR